MKFIKKEFSEEYSKKWNIYMDDYVQLADDNGNLISDSVYRIGGLFAEYDFISGGYFNVIKYVEEYYDDNITTDKTKKPHLEGKHCIIDKNGVEKVICESFSYPYIRKNSVIYSVNKKLYNIETGECYGEPSTEIDGANVVIIENRWGNERWGNSENLKGIFIIDKKTGKKELIDTIK